MNYGEFTISASHPCLSGHFPGHPVVPGVLVLERVIQAVTVESGGNLEGLRRCKFTTPLYPEQLCTVAWQCDGSQVRFECSSADGVVAQGQLQVGNG